MLGDLRGVRAFDGIGLHAYRFPSQNTGPPTLNWGPSAVDYDYVGGIPNSPGARGPYPAQGLHLDDDGVGGVKSSQPAGVTEAPQALVRRHRDRLLVTFAGIEDRTAAEGLAGRYLFVGAFESPALPEDEFWTHDLVGADVRTESGRPLGALREVIQTQANDVWVAIDERGAETLVPALKELVVSVDLAGRTVVVREVPGITSPED